ncbi:MAG: prolipoprotein diacylglyceryl transferase [Terriglobia bacterium]
MRPILIEIGPLTIYSWGVAFVAAFLIGYFITMREAARKEIERDDVTALALYLLIGGLVFARLVSVLVNEPGYYFDNPLRILAFWEGGLAYHGALLGGFLGGLLFSRLAKIRLGVLADLITPALAVGLAIGRIGCFLGGHCHGVVSSVPWAVSFPGLVGRRHPTQIYESVLDFVVFGIIWARRKEPKFDGYLFLTYLILYSFVRIGVEVFRESAHLYGPVTYAQAVSVLIIAGSLVIIRMNLLTPPDESR